MPAVCAATGATWGLLAAAAAAARAARWLLAAAALAARACGLRPRRAGLHRSKPSAAAAA